MAFEIAERAFDYDEKKKKKRWRNCVLYNEVMIVCLNGVNGIIPRFGFIVSSSGTLCLCVIFRDNMTARRAVCTVEETTPLVKTIMEKALNYSPAGAISVVECEVI